MKRTVQFIAGVAFAVLLTTSANAAILYSFDWANGTGATAIGSFEYISGDDFITDFHFTVDGYNPIYLASVTLGADGLTLDQQVGSIDGSLVGTVTDGSTSVTFSDVFPETHFNVNEGSASGSGTGTWVDLSRITPVPEPATIISGMLMLLPFGASTLRILRRRQLAGEAC